MKKRQVLLTGFVLCSLAVNAQAYKDGYVAMGPDSQGFASLLTSWQNDGYKYNEDDNFFISRVKPKARFRNAATQVRQNLTAENDKHLVAWVPVNNVSTNAMPDGVFDSEVFSMWPYVTTWGNWTASLGRIPAAFLDAAHKNGVGVSGVASVPWGGIGTDWFNALNAIANSDADLAVKYFRYMGIDGMGYNSEWSGGQAWLPKLRTFHENIVKKSREFNPLFENIWYDGTNDMGTVTFDRGLGSHNDDTFGDGEHIRTSLFLNYNWSSLLPRSVEYAKQINRDPLDLYAGMNMQGAEGNYWTTLKDYPISIGLWGAHSSNMWWESRNEKGSAADVQQRTYLQRTERWFTGGTRNPANCPAIANSMKYNADNYTFHGMSSLMTARSPLKWDLGEEPFVTFFNLGNGKFFNWKGERQTNKEWYNIGVQDYLPTWRYWFASKLLGREASDVPASGLDADVTWDDAYMGGSTIRIFGTSADEYLHLFKTEYALQEGDVITFRYKVKKGRADVNLVLTAKGAETAAINEGDFKLLTVSQETDEDQWVERTYKVEGALAGKDLALVALHFQNAADLDLYLGEFSIVRGTADVPAQPELGKLTVLANNRSGVDAKLIWNMPNDKAAGEPCYNTDVKTSLFKLYSQQEGEQAHLLGVTTSWAALYYSAPTNVAGSNKIRFGVSAVSLDMKGESEIAWTDYTDAGDYAYSDDVQIDKNVIKPNEEFTLSYVDPKHEEGTWQVLGSDGTVLFEGTGNSVTCTEGLPEVGSYTMKVTGPVYVDVKNDKGEIIETKRETQTREYGAFVQVSPESVGALPKIETLTANGQEADLKVESNDEITLAYTGRHADGSGSQGVALAEQRFGAKCADLGLVGAKSFSVSCWLKVNKITGSSEGGTQLFAVANKLDTWPKTDWGWLWTTFDATGKMGSFTFRGTDASANNELKYHFKNTKLPIGGWVHLAVVFDYNAQGALHSEFYLNGVKQEVVSWERTNKSETAGDPGYQSGVYNITNGMVFSVGGSAHSRDGIDGVIDNFMVWDKAITAEEVKASMGDMDAANLPEDLLAFWDLESAPAADYTFASVGKKAGVAAGLHEYTAGGTEGQGSFKWMNSEFTSGCPFISGSAFPVVTKPTWKAKGGALTDETGNSEAGSAKVTYAKAGDYSVTLTLANSLGSDQRTFQVITVGESTGIGEVAGGQTEAYTVGDQLFVDFAEDGNYVVRVYNIAGQLVASKAQQMSKGQKMQLTLGVAGSYILDVQKDGKTVRTVKLLRK